MVVDMVTPLIALVSGVALLVWSADRFVEGAANTARHFNMPPLLIGMVIVGFGTSAPEMVVSAISAMQGNPGLALGNAYGSNISNIALVLGVTALVSPITVHSDILRKELPILTAVTVLAAYQVFDGTVSLADALLMLAVFGAVMGWSVYQGYRKKDTLGMEMEKELQARSIPVQRSLVWLFTGLVVLTASSRLLVWGAVAVARAFHVDDMIIGLTVVAVGTSLPELASSVLAARKGEHDLALGNVMGSNLFNTLAVVGIAGVIHPMTVPATVFYRDMSVMFILTLSLFVIGYGFRGRKGRVNRYEGTVLLLSYIGYTAWLLGAVFT